MKMRYALLSLALLLPQLALANPFTDGQPQKSASLLQGINLPFLPEILQLQRQIHEAMTTQITLLRDGDDLAPLWILLAVSFAYGIFHVLAPGHGKVIVGSYFIGNRARWREAVQAGLIMAVGHTVTAVAIVTGLYFILGLSQLRVLADARYIELIGYGMIACIGLWLLARAYRGTPTCSHCGHHHHHHEKHAEAAPTHHHRQAHSLFAATSLVPCTGSMIILLFTLAHQILWAGILSVAAIALGMWLTLTVIAFITIFLHRSLTGQTEHTQQPWQQKIQRGLGIFAALLVTLTGGLLFSGTFIALWGG